MKFSDKVFVACFAAGAGAGAWLWFDTGWIWVPLGLALLVTGGLYQAFITQIAKETVIDSEALRGKKR